MWYEAIQAVKSSHEAWIIINRSHFHDFFEKANGSSTGKLGESALEHHYEERLFKIFLSREYDGLGLPLAAGCQWIESCSLLHPSWGWLLAIGSGGAFFTDYLPPATANRYFLPREALVAGSGMNITVWSYVDQLNVSVLTDDRMALEFTAARAMYAPPPGNAAPLRAIAARAALIRSKRASSLSIATGVGRSPLSFMRVARTVLRPSRSSTYRRRSGSSGSGSGAAALHLYNYYWSGLDYATGGTMTVNGRKIVVIEKDDQYVLNHCTRFLARDGNERRHDFGQYEPGDPRARVCEAWRYPVIDSYFDGTSVQASYPFNAVTFIVFGAHLTKGDFIL